MISEFLVKTICLIQIRSFISSKSPKTLAIPNLKRLKGDLDEKHIKDKVTIAAILIVVWF